MSPAARSRGRLLVLALALSVAVAGCGGSAQEEPESTVTPAPVPEGDAQPVVEDDLVAPGVTAERIVDAGALTEAHEQRLSSSSYTVREQVVRRGPDGSVRDERTTVVRRNGSDIRYQQVTRAANGTEVRRVDRWSGGSRTYTARTDRNGTTYSTLNATAGATVAASNYARSLGRVLGLLPVTVTGRTERAGTTYYRLEAAEVRDRPPLSNVSFVGYVGPGGLVRNYTVTYTTDIGAEAIDVTVRVTVEDVGATSVERPAWYGAARNATGAPAREG